MSLCGELKQSTTVTISLGPFVAAADGDTEQTGKTIQDTDIYLSKNGAAKANPNDTNDCTEDADGVYRKQLDATDTGTLGILTIYCHFTDSLYIRQDYLVLRADVYDSKYGSDYQQVDVVQVGGATQSGTDLKDLVDTGYDPTTHKIQGVVLADTCTTNSDMRGTDNALLAANVNVAAGIVEANVKQVSDDSNAANNLEAMYDGTGYSNAVAPAQQQQLNNLSIGSASISVVAGSAVITTGTPTGTYTNTSQRDGVYHQIADVAGTTDLYYQFNVGQVGVPTSVSIYGRSTGLNDPMKVYSYNWVTTSWDQIGTLPGANSDALYNFDTYTVHVGTGANAGIVRIRFANTGLSTAILYLDQVFVSYTNVQSSVGYALGSIWVDTVNGTAGTVVGVNGVADLPVSTWADALTLSAATNIKKFQIISGSTITLSANSDNLHLDGENWTLVLNGQSIASSHFRGAEVSGISTGSGSDFHDCNISNITTDDGEFINCRFSGTFTCGAASTYFIINGASGVAGITAPIFDAGAAIGNTQLNFRNYSGGVDLRNFGATGTDNMSLEGNGQLIINANCTGGIIAIRGNFTITDGSGGAVTLSDDARYDQIQILDAITDDLNKIDGSALNTLTGLAPGSTIAAATDVSGAHTTTDGLISALNDLSAADINSQVSDVLKVDTIAERSQAQPPATPTFEQAIMYLYMLLRNGYTITATEKAMKNNAGTTIWKKTLSDNGTTYTESTGAAGP